MGFDTALTLELQCNSFLICVCSRFGALACLMMLLHCVLLQIEVSHRRLLGITCVVSDDVRGSVRVMELDYVYRVPQQPHNQAYNSRVSNMMKQQHTD